MLLGTVSEVFVKFDRLLVERAALSVRLVSVHKYVCVCVCVCACVRACVRACVCVYLSIITACNWLLFSLDFRSGN